MSKEQIDFRLNSILHNKLTKEEIKNLEKEYDEKILHLKENKNVNK